MIYNETFIGVATTADSLYYIITTYVPRDASIETASCGRQPAVEVWYDKDTNTVILK